MAWATPIALLLAGPLFNLDVLYKKTKKTLKHVRNSNEILDEMEKELNKLRGASK